jgi:hypothetical protein
VHADIKEDCAFFKRKRPEIKDRRNEPECKWVKRGPQIPVITMPEVAIMGSVPSDIEVCGNPGKRAGEIRYISKNE